MNKGAHVRRSTALLALLLMLVAVAACGGSPATSSDAPREDAGAGQESAASVEGSSTLSKVVLEIPTIF